MFIDGHSIAFRAFYALPYDMATTSGEPTNAVFGFVSMLLKAVAEYRPDKIVIVFDPPGKTFRESEFAEYKAQRAETPEGFRAQEPLIHEVVEVLGLPQVEVEGFEADDVIATLAARAAESGDEVLIVTGDRDAIQLVEDPSVKVVYNRKGITDVVEFDEAAVKERYGIAPHQYVDYAALRGDPSDNINGVPGIGEKTAAKLLQKYGSIDGIYEHIEELTPKLRKALEENRSILERNRKLMRLRRDVPLPADPDKIESRSPDLKKLEELFSALEFRSLFQRVKDAFSAELATESRAAKLGEDFSVLEPAAFGGLVKKLSSKGAHVAVGVSAEPPKEKWAPGRSAYVAIFDGSSCKVTQVEGIADPWEEDRARDSVGLTEARQLFSDNSIVKNGHNLVAVARAMGHAHLAGCGFDTAVAVYLLDPGAASQPSLAGALEKYANISFGPKQQSLHPQSDSASAAAEAQAVGVLVPLLRKRLEEESMLSLYEEIECPLIGILASMERIGIRLDVPYLKELSESFSFDARRHEEEVKRLGGEDINVRSTQQLQRVLFEKLKLPVVRATKTGYSTDASALEAIRDQHPIVEEILAFRELERLRTIVDGLLDLVYPDGRVHPHYNQTSAATGRVSSENPNVQNVPIRTTLGRQIRKAFIAEDGWRLITADYSQIELRVMAHLSGDERLRKALSEAHDVHAETASQVFGVKLEDVTEEMRRAAKMVNYGLSYGLEAYGLAQRLAIETDEARRIISRYFESFPGVKKYMDEVVAKARETGYTETIFGRRRYIPQLESSSYQIRRMGERMAMNAPLQGSAADIIKRAMIRLENTLRTERMHARQILQVHDEIVVEAPENEIEEASEALAKAMTGAADLAVPLDIEVGVGRDWDEAKGAS